MEYVSPAASAETWTGTVRLRGRGLPDVAALRRSLEESGQGARLRGVEVSVRGWLSERDGELWLRAEETGELLRLAPLARKVQWDPAREQPRSPTPRESSAYARLRASWKAVAPTVRVTGPLRPGVLLGPDTLEVRTTSWD